MRRRLLLGLVPALPCALLFSACSNSPAALGLALTFPQGLLDQATSVTLSVFDASLATCQASGQVTTIPPAAQVFPLGETSCTNGDVWCATITLDKDGSTKMFSVVAAKAGTTIAEGCTTKTIDQDPLVVEIQVERYAPPACCNDGIIEPGEQCDTGVAGTCVAGQPLAACSGIVEDPVCFCDCTSREVLLSVDDAGPPLLKNLPAGSKSDLTLSFGPGGASNPSVLRAVYESNDASAGSGIDLHESFLAADLYPITDPVPLSMQLEFPVLCGSVEAGVGLPLDQRYPAIATAADDTVVVVYQSNQDSLGDNWDIFLNPQIPDGCTDQKPCTAASQCQTECDTGTCAASVKLDTMGSGATNPRVASGPPGTVLVTWTRSDGIYGRIWRTDGTLVPATNEISIAPGGAAARVTGNLSGFLVAYQGSGPGDHDGVFMQSVDPFGKVGTDLPVNNTTQGLQDQPDIAMVDGSTIVVWHSGGDVFFQRFDASLTRSPNDQSAPLNTTGVGAATDQQHPAVAAANGYFVVAWETPDPKTALGNISARFVGATTGFGYNSVSGQNDEFVATDPLTAGDRHLPAVAMNGYTAIGWEDHAPMHAGIWVRRFPLPAM